jgi:hypothetical protein
MSLARSLLKLSVYQPYNALLESYANNAVPESVASIGATLDYVLASLFPNARPSVATELDLPPTGNEINDYRIVLDFNSTGQAAGYRWTQLEGQATPQWNQVQMFDSQDSILQQWETNAAGIFVPQLGVESTDGTTIHGSTLPNGNLTLSANSGDGTTDPALQTGYIQFFGNSRPTDNNAYDIGTATHQFASLYLGGNISDGVAAVTVAQMLTAYNHSQILSGNPHQVAYAELLSRLGNFTVDGDVTTQVIDLSTGGNKTLTITITDDSHNHTTSTITDFDDATWGLIKGALVDSDTITWEFNDGAKEAIGTAYITTEYIDNIDDPAPNKILTSDDTGAIWRISDGTVELNGDITGTGVYNSTSDKVAITTTTSNTPITSIDRLDISNLDATATASNPTEITQANHGMQTGRKVRLFGFSFDAEYAITVTGPNTYTIGYDNSLGTPEGGYIIPNGSQFLYDSISDTWQVQLENAQLSHFEISDLLADDHTQYNLINGRTDGTNNAVTGGELAGANLYLRSTSNATKGDIRFEDNLVPETGATYSGGWSGTDIGTSSRRIRDLFMYGVISNLRLEALASLPSPSIEEKGRIVILNGGDLYCNKDGATYTKLVDFSHVNVANGVCPLDGASKVPIANIPDALIGAVVYQGAWDANTNTPDISLLGQKGHYYVVSVSGTTNIDGISDWNATDVAIHNGSVWEKIDNTDSVLSVNGYTGIVSLNNTDIGLGNVTNDAQLTRGSGDLNLFTEKIEPVENDIVVIEDSEDSFSKKKVKLENMLGSGSGGGGSFQWQLGDTAPLEEFESFMDLLSFDHLSTNYIYALVTIPASYKAGDQITLKDAKIFSPTGSGNIYMRTKTTLRRVGEAFSTIANQHTSTNTELTITSAVNLFAVGDLDLTDGSGLINGQTPVAGDILVIELYRDLVNETASTADYSKFIKYSASVSFKP